MIEIKRTSSSEIDFQHLVSELDGELSTRNGETNEFFAQYNKIDQIKNVIIATIDNKPVGCGAMKAYDSDNDVVWTELVDLSGTEDWSWVEVDVDTENIVKLEFVAPEHSIWPSVDKMTIGTK